MKAIFLDTASDDLEQAIEYLENEREGEGAKFRAKVREAVGRILMFPYASTKLKRRFRVCQLKKYRRFGILFRKVRRVIFIHGIIHLQRGKRFWNERMR